MESSACRSDQFFFNSVNTSFNAFLNWKNVIKRLNKFSKVGYESYRMVLGRTLVTVKPR